MRQANCAFTTTPNAHTSALVFSARSAATDKTPIASLARGSVQSGFNEVAHRAQCQIRVARPHRSLQIRTGRNFQFKLCVIPPPDLDELTLAQLRELVAMLLTKMAALEQKVIEQREEIARLKGLKGRPDIKPSGMDKGTEPARPGRQGQHLRRGKVRPRVNVETNGGAFQGLGIRRNWYWACMLSLLRERWVAGGRGSSRHCPRARGTTFAGSC